MKLELILFFLVLNNCNGAQIVKRFVKEQNNSTNDSFHVKVSAGYGVHPENSTISTSSPVYKFQEKLIQRDNDTTSPAPRDQISEPSQNIIEVLPSPSYQVHEKTYEVQQKNFPAGKNNRYRSVEKKVRHRNNEVHKSVNNNLEVKNNIQQNPELVAGTKIVEVLRVPAMYELRLQSDPQRLVQLNTAWMSKLNGWMSPNQYKKSMVQPFYQFGGTKNLLQLPQNNVFQQPQHNVFQQPEHNVFQQPQNNVFQQSFAFQQPQSIDLGLAQSAGGYSLPNQRIGTIFQNLKSRFANQKSIGQNQQTTSSYGVNQPITNSYHSQPVSNSYDISQPKSTPQEESRVQKFAGFKFNYIHPQNFESTYPNIQGGVSVENTVKKPITENPKQNSFNNQELLSEEIPSEYYQKPQALHEVPAPVLNKQSYKTAVPKIQATSIPSLVYGKPVDPPYQPTTQSSVPTASIWDGNVQNQNIQIGLGANYHIPTTDSLSNYYQPQQNEKLNNFGQDFTISHNPQYQKQNLFNQIIYQKTPQNYYNDAIGEYLDQTLASINGGVATYLNNDGTMTISNYNHAPKLVQSPGEYENPVTENTEMGEIPHDFGATNQNGDANNFNSQMYSDYRSEIPITEDDQIETAENQGYSVQNNAHLTKLLVTTSRSSSEEAAPQKYEPMSYRKKYMSKKMYPKQYSSRRMEPMDYILYIKERTFD